MESHKRVAIATNGWARLGAKRVKSWRQQNYLPINYLFETNNSPGTFFPTPFHQKRAHMDDYGGNKAQQHSVTRRCLFVLYFRWLHKFSNGNILILSGYSVMSINYCFSFDFLSRYFLPSLLFYRRFIYFAIFVAFFVQGNAFSILLRSNEKNTENE